MRLLAIACLLAALLGASDARAIDIDVWEFPRIPDPADPYDRFSWLRSLCARFETDHPGVRVRLTELSWQNGGDKLKIAVYSGSPPDLTSGALPVKMVQQGVLDPTDDFLTRSDRQDYLPGTLESFRFGGRTWGWPWCSVGDLLYVNLELASAAGVQLPEDGSWTWEEFLEAARRLTKPEGAGSPVHGFGFVSVLDRSADYGLLCLDGARPLPGPGEPGLDSPQAAASLGRLIDLVNVHRVSPPNAGGMEDKDLWQAFSERRSVACAPFGLWALKALERKKPFPYAVMGYPGVAGRRGRSPVATSGYYVFRQSDLAKRRLCHELARFLTSGVNQRLLATYGQFPTRRSAGELYASEPGMRRAQAIVSGGFPLPVHPRWGQLDARIKSAVQLVLLGKASAGQTLAELASEAKRLGGAVESETRPPPTRGHVEREAARFRGVLFGLLLMLVGGGGLVLGRLRKQLGDVSAYGFLLPSALVFAAFTAWPVARALLLAFQDYWPGAGTFEGFVGLENFRQVLASREFHVAVGNTLLYTAFVVPAQIALGLVLASLLYPLASGARNFFRAAFYLPGVASVVVLAMVWRWLYDDSFGLLNNLLATPLFAPVYQLLANLTPLIARPGFALAALYVTVFACLAARDLLRAPRLAGVLAAGAAMAGIGWLTLGIDWAWHPKQPIRWLTSTELSLFSIALSTVLKGPGGALLIYLAAMEAIPAELFEAAKSDGAGPFQRWWHVTLPLVKPTTLFLAITGAIDSFQVFAQVLMLTDGGPAGSSSVLVHQMYTRAFRDLDFGHSSAMALMLFFVLVGVSFVQYRYLRSDWEY